MQLRFSVLARNRVFSKAMRRVRTKLQPLLDAFGSIELEHSIHEAILVAITDDQPPQFFEEVENNDGFFQVLAGCSHRGGDDELVDYQEEEETGGNGDDAAEDLMAEFEGEL